MSRRSDPASTRARESSRSGFDVERVRADFPILGKTVHGKPLVYLDNAATTQKPRSVLDTIERHYTFDNSNVHRGVHTLSVQATRAYEGGREKVRGLINAADTSEIVFVRGTTEAVNLVAQSFGGTGIGAGDEIIISEMEHHSNIVPWQMLRDRTGAVLRVIPINDRGELQLDKYAKLLSPKTRLVAVVHVSNSLGSINPVKEIVAMAHDKGVPVLIDAAQAIPHVPVDVQELDCDFLAFSAHKMYGPTGVGVLYGKKELLEKMPPYQGGGDMILSVTFEKTTYNTLPYKFEAGTPNVAGVVAFGAAIDYIQAIGLEAIQAHEDDLVRYATVRLSDIPGLKIIGTAGNKAAVVSFILDGVHAHDLGTVVDHEGVAIRTGHHCTQPVMEHFRVPATSRASFGVYNTRDEIDALVRAIHKAREVFE